MKNTTEELEVIRGPEIIMEKEQASAAFVVEASRPTFKKFVNATVKGNFSAFIKRNSADTTVFIRVGEKGAIEICLPDNTVIDPAGYNKETILKILDDYTKSKFNTELLEYIAQYANRCADKILDGGIKIIHTSVRENYLIHGADIKDELIFEQFSDRVVMEAPHEMNETMVILTSDKEGEVLPQTTKLAIVNEKQENAEQNYQSYELPLRKLELDAFTACVKEELDRQKQIKQREEERAKEKEKRRAERKEQTDRIKENIINNIIKRNCTANYDILSEDALKVANIMYKNTVVVPMQSAYEADKVPVNKALYDKSFLKDTMMQYTIRDLMEITDTLNIPHDEIKMIPKPEPKTGLREILEKEVPTNEFDLDEKGNPTMTLKI